MMTVPPPLPEYRNDPGRHFPFSARYTVHPPHHIRSTEDCEIPKKPSTTRARNIEIVLLARVPDSLFHIIPRTNMAVSSYRETATSRNDKTPRLFFDSHSLVKILRASVR